MVCDPQCLLPGRGGYVHRTVCVKGLFENDEVMEKTVRQGVKRWSRAFRTSITKDMIRDALEQVEEARGAIQESQACNASKEM